jgi:hypothetical protein
LNVDSKPYVTQTTFDPTNLKKTDKFGVVPTNTTLTITYTANTSATSNASAGSVTTIVAPNLLFSDRGSLSETIISTMVDSLEVENEEPITGETSELTSEEIKIRALGAYSSQNRAVTREDYISACYRMPSKFGKIKRVNVVRDVNSLKRNLNLYAISEDVNGNLSTPNSALKQNLKTWLDNYRMINDTIDILDGNIINIGINYEVIADLDTNKYELLQACNQAIIDNFLTVKFNLGESIFISDIYKVLNDVPGVTDTKNIEFTNKVGGSYSDVVYDIRSNMSNDGRYLTIPQDSVVEVLLPNTDIVGVIV